MRSVNASVWFRRLLRARRRPSAALRLRRLRGEQAGSAFVRRMSRALRDGREDA